MRQSLKQGLTIIAFAIIAIHLNAQGNLTDSSFGVYGRVRPRFDRNPTYDEPTIDKKNRIMIVTDTIFGNGDKGVVIKRFNVSGQLDNTFNTNGILVINHKPNNNGESDFEYSSSLLFLTDHRITFIITTESGNSWYRINENGTPDAGFGTNGKKAVPDGLDFDNTTVTNENNFISVMVDFETMPNLLVYKFTTAGNTDNTFATNGLATIDLESLGTTLREVFSVLLDVESKIIVTGQDEFGGTLCGIRLNPDGTVDEDYGIGGFFEIQTESDAGEQFRFFGTQLTSDGKLLFTGYDDNTATAVLRMDTNGMTDDTFGASGLLQFSFFGGTRFIYNASGSAGTSTWIGGFEKVQNQYRFLVGKRMEDGNAEESFGTDGFTTIGINNQDAIGYVVKEVANGKVLIMGFGMFNNYYGITVVQLLSNGSPDISFGNNGVLYIKGVDPTRNTKNASPTTSLSHLTAGPANSTLITGHYEDGGLNEGSLYVQQLNEYGLPDNAFGTNSLATITPMFGAILYSNYLNGIANGKIVRQPNGKIVVAYNIYDVFTGYNIMLQRLTATGQLDNTFGTGGRTLIAVSDFPFEEFSILDLKTAPNGKIAMTVQYEDFDLEQIQTPIFQFTDNGAPDNSFSGDGVLRPEFMVTKLAYASDNKLVAMGYRNKSLNECCKGIAIRRYNANGSFDNTFNGGNSVFIKYSTEDDRPVALLIESDNAVTALFTPLNSNRTYGIAKFDVNGLPVAGWGTNGIFTATGAGFPDNWIDGLKLENGGFIFAGTDATQMHLLNFLKTHSNGSPDISFSTDGIGEVDFSPAVQFSLDRILLKPGGKIIAGGNEFISTGGLFNQMMMNAVITQIKTSPTVSLVYTLINPGNWSNAANWLNGLKPPSVIPAGTEVIINPGGNGEGLLDVDVTVQFGGKIVVKPGKKLNVAANLTVPAITTE